MVAAGLGYVLGTMLGVPVCRFVGTMCAMFWVHWVPRFFSSATTRVDDGVPRPAANNGVCVLGARVSAVAVAPNVGVAAVTWWAPVWAGGVIVAPLIARL